MKTLFFLLLANVAIGQDTLLLISDTDSRDTTEIRDTTHRSDTLQAEWVVIAGSDGILRKERQVVVVKEYDYITNGFWHVCENVKYRRVNGELIDVVMIK